MEKDATVEEVKADFTGKGIGLMLASSFFLEEGARVLKEDRNWYKYENKQLLNNLLLKNIKLVKKEQRLVNLLSEDFALEETKKITNNEDLETDDILYALSVEKKIFINFIYLFLSGTDEGIQNLDVLLESLKNKLQLFTQVDLKHILKDFAEKTTVVKYDDDYFDNFINQYK